MSVPLFKLLWVSFLKHSLSCYRCKFEFFFFVSSSSYFLMLLKSLQMELKVELALQLGTILLQRMKIM